jgi:hypothetical protein
MEYQNRKIYPDQVILVLPCPLSQYPYRERGTRKNEEEKNNF